LFQGAFHWCLGPIGCIDNVVAGSKVFSAYDLPFLPTLEAQWLKLLQNLRSMHLCKLSSWTLVLQANAIRANRMPIRTYGN